MITRRLLLASCVLGLLSNASPAMIVTIVALSGPHAYTGGVPSLTNGGVGNNAFGGGLRPSQDGPGIAIQQDCFARIGIVIELFPGDTIDDTQNKLSAAFVFFNQQTQGVAESIDLAEVDPTALNDAGDPWQTLNFTSGMSYWIGPDGILTGNGPAPFIEDYHSIQFDDVAAGGGGGNSAEGEEVRPIINLVEITVHARGLVGHEARVVFDLLNTEFFHDDTGGYSFASADPLPGSPHSGNPGTAGLWYARNGRVAGNAFPIEIVGGLCEEGACCLPSALCIHRTASDCAALNGVFQAVGERCVGRQVVLIPNHTGPQSTWSHEIHTIAGGTCDNRRGAPPPCANAAVKIDAWVTWEGGTSCHLFGHPAAVPIPPGFFGPGSDPFTGTVCFVGEPLGATPYGDFGMADTLVRRSGDPFTRFAPVSPNPSTVDIEVVALNLVSTAPITVTYGGASPETWDARVDLSSVHTDADPGNDPPLGSLTATKTHCNGGTYFSTVSVQPRFTFTNTAQPSQVRVLDTGEAGQPPVTMTMDEDHWVMDVDPDLHVDNPICTKFHPGLREIEPATECTGACCRASGCTEETESCHFVCNVFDHQPATFRGCLGDTDGNGVVNPADRGVIAASVGTTDNVMLCLADLDGNGVVNPGDRGIVSANIDQCVDVLDFQNGSGLNHGAADSRFNNGAFMGIGSQCGQCP